MIFYLLLYAAFLFLAFKVLERLNILKFNGGLVKRGQTFFGELMALPGGFQVSKDLSFTVFKFYTDVVSKLIESAKQYGSPINGPLAEIKVALSRDIHFETKLQSSLINGILQMFLIFTMGALFSYVLSEQLEIQIPLLVAAFVILWQLIGLLLFFLLFVHLKRVQFRDLDQVIKRSYLTRAYLFCQIPISLILKRISMDTFEPDKKGRYLKARLTQLIKKLKEEGSLEESEFNIFINELWLIYDFAFDAFEKKLIALKMLIIFSFFLPSYLFIMYSFLEMTSL